jgi:cell fate regulator YaaT (PSP1 superfamily)
MEVVGIRFKPAGKILQYATMGLPLQRGDKCVAESENGVEIATVVLLPEEREVDAEQTSIKPVMRQATVEDLEQAEGYRALAQEAFTLCRQRIAEMHMPMKLVEVEYTLDGRKAIFYFTADGRVDFRQLVRSLASSLQTRIEMRQIGVRDEAAQLSGVGRCGREYCCSSWLKELSPVNLGLAKDQHLSLNPTQISGGCGRLLCCLKYEHEFYVAARRRFPKEGKTIRTSLGPERVVAVDIFRERVFLRSEEHGSRIISLVQLKDEVEQLGEVLMTAEHRAKVAAQEAEASGEGGTPVVEGLEAEDASQRPERRRRRRGRDSGGTPQG